MALDRYVETVLRGEDVTRAFGQLVLHLRELMASPIGGGLGPQKTDQFVAARGKP